MSENKILLSILIPTVVGREEQLDKLWGRIYESFGIKYNFDEESLFEKQRSELFEDIQIVAIKDNKEITIGEKRELLYNQAKGLYSVQWDDDDDIADFGIQDILKAIEDGNDCITYEERVRLDGVEYKSNHSLKYSGWFGDGSRELSDGFHFWRTPFFKSVIKTEIAKSVPIPHERYGEDNMWADALHKVLKTETHINKQIYLYEYVSTPHNERYGISL